MLAVWSVLIVAGGLTGCSGGTKNEIVPVQGSVAFADGSKLPAGTQLLFNPSEGGVGAAVGTTTEDGSFEVVHPSGSKGAEVGKYTVQLRAPEGQDADFYKSVKQEFYDPGGADGRGKERDESAGIRRTKSQVTPG